MNIKYKIESWKIAENCMKWSKMEKTLKKLKNGQSSKNSSKIQKILKKSKNCETCWNMIENKYTTCI